MITNNLAKKIQDLNGISKIASQLRQNGKTIVQCHGVFDLVHPGHIHMFNQARKIGDVLIVSIVDDKHVQKGPGRPYFPERARLEWLASLEQVDYVVLCDDFGPWKVLKTVKPDTYVRGKESAHLLNDPLSGLSKDKELVESLGGKIFFTESLPVHSTDLLKEHFTKYSDSARAFFAEFKKRRSLETIKETFARLRNLRVLLIGETIIDEYHYVATLGKPSKSNVISTKYIEHETFPGGILACANHLNDFTARIDLLTVLGDDNSHEEYARDHLKSNILPIFFHRANAPTIVKRRFVDPAYLGKMFEICFLNDANIEPELENRIIADLKIRLPEYDAVIVADYGHGLLTPKIIDTIVAGARFLAVNTQTNSANQGFNPITKYPRMDYACIDEPEIRMATNNRYDDVHGLISKVATDISASVVSITRGHKGSIVWKNGEFTELPALSTKVIDPIGAGDAYLSISALAAATNQDAEVVGFLGNVAGAMATRIVCNRSTISIGEYLEEVSEMLR